MSTMRLFKTITLPNGITLYCYDKSKHVVGDRWYVCLRIEVPVKVSKEFFNGHQDPERAYNEFVEAFGDTYIFSYEKERNFIAEGEVNSLLNELLNDFMKNSANYLQHPGWKKMCVIKAYRDWQEKSRIRKLHEEMIREADKEE